MGLPRCTWGGGMTARVTHRALAVIALASIAAAASYSGSYCPVGLENLRVPDAYLSESSSMGTKSTLAKGGRLRTPFGSLSDGAWIPEIGRGVGSYAEILLDSPATITAISTQGEARTGIYTKKYQVQYKALATDSAFAYYAENSETVTFTGNSDSSTVVTRTIAEPFHAQVIRILPTDWNNFATPGSQPALRIELHATCVWAHDFVDEIGKGMLNGESGTIDMTGVDWVIDNSVADFPKKFQVTSAPPFSYLDVQTTGNDFRSFRKQEAIVTTMYKSVDVAVYVSSRGPLDDIAPLEDTVGIVYEIGGDELSGPSVAGNPPQNGDVPSALQEYWYAMRGTIADTMLKATLDVKVRFRVNDDIHDQPVSYRLFYVWITGIPYNCTTDMGTYTSDSVCVRCDGVTGYQDDLTPRTECKPVADCPAGQFETTAPTRSSARVCGDCPSNTFRLAGDDNDECHAVSVCTSGQYVSEPATLTSDTVCRSCATGTFSGEIAHLNADACVPWQSCSMGSEFVSTAGTPSTDRVCTACSLCAIGKYMSSGCLDGTDSVCSDCTSGFTRIPNRATRCTPWHGCEEGEYESVGGTATADRTCSTCSACDAGFYEEVACTEIGDTECELCITDKSMCYYTGYLSGECTATSGPECIPCLAMCASCSDANTCDTCRWGMVLSSSGECADSCAPNEFVGWVGVNDARCVSCDETCHTCNDAGPNECESCMNPATAPETAGEDPDAWRFLTLSTACVTECDTGYYKDIISGSCKAETSCPSQTYVRSAPSEFSDRVCAPVSECAEGQYEVVAPTPTSNRVCEICALGTMFDATQPFPDRCVVCPVGEADHDIDPLTPCSRCPAGSFVPRGSIGACSQFVCAAGRTDSDSNPETACTACEPGKTSTQGSVGRCMLCETTSDDDFVPTTERDAPNPPPIHNLPVSLSTGPLLNTSSVLCPVTTEFYGINISSSGRYAFSAVFSSPTASGQVALLDGDGALVFLRELGGSETYYGVVHLGGLAIYVLVVTGYANTTGEQYTLSVQAVHSCIPGWYEAGPNECLPCPRGYFQDLEGASSCFPCIPGTVSDEGSRFCVYCDLHTFSAQNASVICEPCPRGQFAESPGSASCMECADGGDCSERGEPEPPPPVPIYPPHLSRLMIFTMLIRLVHTTPTPEVDIGLIELGVNTSFGLEDPFLLRLDDNYEPRVYGNILYIALVSMDNHTLTEVGARLQAREHYYQVGENTHADFTRFHVFSTPAARCERGIYPLLPISDHAVIYPALSLPTLALHITHAGPPEIRNISTPCPLFACMEGFTGLQCAHIAEGSDADSDDTSTGLTTAETAGAVVGAILGTGIFVALAVWLKRGLATHVYTAVSDGV